MDYTRDDSYSVCQPLCVHFIALDAKRCYKKSPNTSIEGFII